MRFGNDPQLTMMSAEPMLEVAFLRAINRQGKLAANPTTAVLCREELVAEIEVDSRWPAGYGQMTVVKFPMDK